MRTTASLTVEISRIEPLAAELAARLLEEAGVAVLAGTAFGEIGAEHLRLSYANSQENLREAITRMRTFIGQL